MTTSPTSPTSSVSTPPGGTPPPAPLSLDIIEQEKQKTLARLAELQRMEQEQANQQVQKIGETIDRFRKELGAETDADLITIIRNRGIRHPKAKRLTKATLEAMHFAFKEGATADAVAAHFKISRAAANARKREWKLTHRKGIKPKPIEDIMRRYKPKQVA